MLLLLLHKQQSSSFAGSSICSNRCSIMPDPASYGQERWQIQRLAAPSPNARQFRAWSSHIQGIVQADCLMLLVVLDIKLSSSLAGSCIHSNLAKFETSVRKRRVKRPKKVTPYATGLWCRGSAGRRNGGAQTRLRTHVADGGGANGKRQVARGGAHSFLRPVPSAALCSLPRGVLYTQIGLALLMCELRFANVAVWDKARKPSLFGAIFAGLYIVNACLSRLSLSLSATCISFFYACVVVMLGFVHCM